MCYSAMVNQGLKSGLRWKARIQTDMFEELFRRRTHDASIKIAKALEANFLEPTTAAEERIKGYIEAHHLHQAALWEAELFTQKKRLADAERKLKTRETKGAREEQRVAGNKVNTYLKKLTDLRRSVLTPEDARIFPFWYAPVFVLEHDEYVVKPMRYHCRPNGKPKSFDQRFDGLYNARRDSLENFWKDLFGAQHACVVLSSFYENVALHDYEQRELDPGEKEKNLVLHFNPRPATEMRVACLWDRWQYRDEPDLYSFAIITDDPPPEVAATGHNRCVIPLAERNVRAWLTPAGRDRQELYRLLDEREHLYYEHRLAA